METYSQNNEQQIILDYFGKDFTGHFLDLGSNDGITLSNTYALALSGWQGVCVEASPKAFQKLKKAHPFTIDIEYYNFAMGNFNGYTVLYESGEHLGKGDVALLSSIKKSETKRWDKEIFEEVKVPVHTFESFLKKTRRKEFHFISLDIEGMELEVLPQMDLNALDCRLICVEFNGKEKEKYDEIILPQGFRLIHTNAENLIYAK